MRNLFFLIFLSANLLCCTGQSQTVQPTLKLSMISGVPVVDGVYLNGQGPFRFLLDTGNESNQVDELLASRLRLASTFSTEVDTPGGSLQVGGTVVNRMSLGPVEAHRQEFLLMNTSGGALRAIAKDVVGILGQSFLRNFDYMLDLRHHRIVFGEQASIGTRVPFRLVHGCMMVPSNLGDLMLDSGTDTFLLFHASPLPANASIVTTSGRAPVGVGRAPALRIGGREYNPTEASYRPLAGAPAAGLLPASLFNTIYVSNSRGYVVFNPSR